MTTYISTTLDGTTTSVTGGPVPLYLDDISAISFHQHWNNSGTGDLVGTTSVEATNDTDAVRKDIRDGTSTARWEDVTASLTTVTNPSSGEGDGIINFSLAGWAWVRVKCARSSGDGSYRVLLNINLQ